MLYLVAASLIWAFSFGLIKHKLVQVGVDPFFIAFVRLSLSLLAFLPFFRWRQIGWRRALRLAAIGGVQYGLMYVLYLASYAFLKAHQVALFTVLTPIYVAAINDIQDRSFHRRAVLLALMAVAGATFVVWGEGAVGGALKGFCLLQGANLCFAYGQVAYRREMAGAVAPRDYQVFAALYAGAVLVAAVPGLLNAREAARAVGAEQVATLLYLGLVPSGLCFYLWNAGARRTTPGFLAVMNNAKVPLAVLCSLALFGEKANLIPLLLGGGAVVVAALLAAKK